MIFSEYQRLSKRTMNIDTAKPSNSLANFGMGLSGEAGEVTDLLKKHIFHKHPLDKEKVKEELGDCLFYIVGLCEVLGLQIGDVAASNVRKLEKRYGDGFSPEASINRKD